MIQQRVSKLLGNKIIRTYSIAARYRGVFLSADRHVIAAPSAASTC